MDQQLDESRRRHAWFARPAVFGVPGACRQQSAECGAVAGGYGYAQRIQPAGGRGPEVSRPLKSWCARRDYSALRASPYGVALAGDQRRGRDVVEPLFCVSWVRPVEQYRDRLLSTLFESGAPGGIRTHDPRLRRPILYPAELQARLTGRRYYSPPTSRVQPHALRRAGRGCAPAPMLPYSMRHAI